MNDKLIKSTAMAASGKFFARFSRDRQKLAATYLEGGDKRKAAEVLAKAGDYARAAELAAEIRDEPLLVRCSLLGTLGFLPAEEKILTARQAGDLLASAGHFRQAVALFDLAGDLRRAATAALKASEHEAAARLFEKSHAWPEAAACYEKAGLIREALRALESEAKSLARNRSELSPRLQEVNLKRSALLLELGRSTAAVNLLLPLPSSSQKAELLARAGRHAEAIDAYLAAGEPDKALALAKRSPDEKRWVAVVHRRSGRLLQAAQLFDQIGLKREAAEAYEAAGEWGHAAYRWESAREPERAAEVYRRAGLSREAARCFAAAGRRDLAVPLYVESGDLAAAAALHLEAGEPVEAVGLLAEAGDATRALAILERIGPRDPDFFPAALLLAPKLVESGRYQAALDSLRRPAQAAPWEPGDVRSVDVLYWQGRALEGLDRHAEAREVYDWIAGQAPRHRDVIQRLAAVPSAPRQAPLESTGARQVAAEQELTVPVPPAPLVEVGRRLAERYDILGEIGCGGMGKVYKAQDTVLGEVVAIKTLLSAENEPGSRERLLRELQICRRISHPNVVRVFDVGLVGEGVFLTMEYLEGQLLDRFISGPAPEPLGRVRSFLAEIAAGLREAHSLGIVHRDLKPSNIMVTPRCLKILDFGIARMAGDPRLTQAGFAMGSPMYMSPEQLMARPLDGRSDLYALGVVAFSLLAGREPFDYATPTFLALQQLREALPDVRRFRPEVPEPWVAFVDKLAAKDPEQRYASADEVLAALAALPV
jgi:tetratricopeptide (TPR) repeat protein